MNLRSAGQLCVLMGFVFTYALLVVVKGVPPSNVECLDTEGCVLKNAYGVWPDRSTCKAAAVVYPTAQQEIVSAVAGAVKNHRSIKVITNTGHSIPKFACPRGEHGLLISTRDYRGITVDKDAKTVTAQAGVELRELIDTIAEADLALAYTPYWEGITLGGLLSTGCHGSSLFGKGSAVHEYVVAMSLVIPASAKEGYARLITLTENDEQLNAAKVSLGVLGVISEVTLDLQPQFKRNITKLQRKDVGLEDEIIPFGEAHEFGDFTWYPSQNEVIYSIDDRVPDDTPGEGYNDFIGFRGTLSVLVETLRVTEETFEALGHMEGKCLQSDAQTAAILAIGTGLINHELLFTGYPVVGYQNRMQAAGGCLYAKGRVTVCPWDSEVKGLFYHQTTISVPLTKIKDFILDVKKLRDMDPTSLCGVDLYYGFLMRFVKASSAYLGEQEDALDIDITYYRAKEGDTPRLKEDVVEEIEQMALWKYGGRPHWGKNRPMAFHGVMAKYPKVARFLEVKREFDPEGLFSSEWSDAVLNISGTVVSNHDYCALEGLCVCSHDRHCAPDKGYFCRPGKVFDAARVCRWESSEPTTARSWKDEL